MSISTRAADGARLDITRHELLSASAPLALVSAPQASFTVTTLADVVDADDGVLSLREAVDLANTTRGQDTITFAPTLAGGTISLTGGPLTITDALVIDGDPLDRGASGIILDGDSPWLSDSGDGSYDPIRIDRANVRLEDLTITNSYGSGVTADRSNVELHRVAITESIGPGDIVGIRVMGGTLLASETVMHHNRGEAGAAIRMTDNARVTVLDSDLGHNAANYGFGIVGNGSLTVERSTIAEIQSVSSFGITLVGSARIVDSTFSRIGWNDAATYGAAIRIRGSLELINSTITETYNGDNPGNEAAITLDAGAQATVINTTITGTMAGGTHLDTSAFGFGIGLESGAMLRIANSIVDDAITGPGSLFSNGGNLFRDTVVANARPDDVLGVTAEQVFAQTRPTANGFRAGVLADNGGPTQTVALLDSPDNPALGAAVANAAPAADQRGFLRDARPDSGAFELDADSIPPATLGPVAAADTFTVDAAALGKKSASFAILANDTVQTGKLVPNSVVLLGAPVGGSATLKKGVLIYKPDADFAGREELSYTVQDNGGRTSNPATVTIEVTQPPLTQAADDAFALDGASVPKKGARLDILANDTPGFGKLQPKSVALVDAPDNGTVTINKGALLYIPAPGFEGADEIAYTVTDATGRASNPATVTIAVTQPPLPQAADDGFTIDGARVPKNGTRLDILANDIPGFGKLQPKSVALVDAPDNGTVTINKGALLYKPEAGFEGTDAITYTVADATGRASDTATVALTVTQPPLPQAGDDSFTLDAARIGRNGARLDILVNDTPGFGKLQPKSVAITEGPENGTIRLDKGTLFYTPEPEFDGTDLIRYTVTDATGRASNEATVTVTVEQPASALLSADLLDDGPDLLTGPQSAAASAPATTDLAMLITPAEVA